MKKQVAIAEQTVYHKNAEAQAVQGKIDRLDTQFSKKTALLQATQEKELAEQREIAQKQLSHVTENVRALEDTTATLILKREDLKTQVAEQERELEASKKEVYDVQSNHDKLIVDMATVTSELSVLRSTKSALEGTIAELSDKETVTRIDTMSLQQVYKDWQERVKDIEAIYTKKVEAVELKEAVVASLNGKVIDYTQELEGLREESITSRNELAKWQKRLEERDKNLRIREAKVEQSESKLVNNASLLNL